MNRESRQQSVHYKTLNTNRYGQLLAAAAPRVIRSDKELDHFTSVLEKLEQNDDCSREEKELAELISVLIDMRRSVMPIARTRPNNYAGYC